MIYGEREAKEALKNARRAFKLAKSVLSSLGYSA